MKPTVKLIGQDGNAFTIIGKVRRELTKAGLENEAKKFVKEAMQSTSYDALLRLVMEYCEVE